MDTGKKTDPKDISAGFECNYRCNCVINPAINEINIHLDEIFFTVTLAIRFEVVFGFAHSPSTFDEVHNLMCRSFFPCLFLSFDIYNMLL